MLINFRDFGGDHGADGRRVRTGRLFRSGHMANPDADAASALAALDFTQVIDLRYLDEREKDPSPWSGDRLDRVLAHDGAAADDAPHLQILAAARSDNSDIDQAYAVFYSALPYDSWYRPLFAEAVRRIADTNGRVLVHCTAGKDRTGTLVALLLDLLGVPREAIVADYMRSQGASGLDRLRDEVVARIAKPNAPAVDQARADALIGVKPLYVRAVFDAVERRSGSTARYFEEGGVEQDVIRQLRASLLTR